MGAILFLFRLILNSIVLFRLILNSIVLFRLILSTVKKVLKSENRFVFVLALLHNL